MGWWPARTPFEVVVGAILTQNTAWANVERALARLAEGGPLTPARLLGMPRPALAEAIRSSGYYNAKAVKLAAISEWYLRPAASRPCASARSDPCARSCSRSTASGPRRPIRSCATPPAGARRWSTPTRGGSSRATASSTADLPYEGVRAWLEARLTPSQWVYEEFHALFVRAGYHNCKPAPACAGCPATTPRALL